ncbi:MAG: hypothetical protein LUC34_01250 [Campylobacter sp.]|nr:hypothetical protein [Campylobacter sp.]
MLHNMQNKLFNQSVKNINDNTNLGGLSGNEAFIDFITLQSVLYEKFIMIAEDSGLSDEVRIRAIESATLVQSTINFFENYKKSF